jgi:hypothetical protein
MNNLTNDQIRKARDETRAEYSALQRKRGNPNLTALQRWKLEVVQKKKMDRITKLGNLLNQRFKWN